LVERANVELDSVGPDLAKLSIGDPRQPIVLRSNALGISEQQLYHLSERRTPAVTDVGENGKGRREYEVVRERHREPQMDSLVRLHRAFGRINAAMIRAGSQSELFESIALLAAETRLFSALSVSLQAGNTGCANKAMCYCRQGTPACFSAELSRHIAEIAKLGDHGRDAMVFNDLRREATDHPWLQEVSAAGHAAMASLPIKNCGKTLGRLFVLSSEPYFFNHECMARLKQLAADMAYLLTRLDDRPAACTNQDEAGAARMLVRRLIDHLQVVREDERQLIARELHDELGQSLSALKLDILGLERSMGIDEAKCAARLVHMKTLIADAFEETHRIVAAKRPLILEERGLAPAIEWLAGEFSKQTGISCEATIDPTVSKCAEALATAAFRSVQECLTNISRHAAGKKVKITVLHTGHALNLCIVDDGLGLSADAEQRGRCGLLGLRQRAKSLGGHLVIESRPNRGTTIKISLPVVPPAGTTAGTTSTSMEL
jgi:signal transduction histidine kinase